MKAPGLSLLTISSFADVNHRNCVTGNGVESWDSKPNKLNTPRIHKGDYFQCFQILSFNEKHFVLFSERNPVTGEKYTIISPATTPTKPMQNGFAHLNGSSTPVQNGKAPTQNGSAPAMNGNGNVENGN